MNGEYDRILFWDLPGEDPVDCIGEVGLTDIVDPHFFPMDRHIANLQDAIDAIREKRPPKLDAVAFLKSEVAQGRLRSEGSEATYLDLYAIWRRDTAVESIRRFFLTILGWGC